MCGRGLLIQLLLLLLAPSAAVGGAWTQPPGSTFAKLSLLGQSARDRWGCRGGTMPADPAGDFVSRQVFLYVERGWTSRVTVTGSFAYKDQRIDGDASYGTRSTGDLRLGARLGLTSGRRPLAIEAILSVPTYPRSDLSAPVADREQFLPAGSGRVEEELHLLWGFSFFPWPLYGNLDVGYRERGGGFVGQWLAAAEVGASGPHLFGKVELRWTLPERESCAADEAVGAVALQERLVSFGPEGAVRVHGPWWLGLGYTQPLAGRNTLDGGQWSLAVLFWGGG